MVLFGLRLNEEEFTLARKKVMSHYRMLDDYNNMLEQADLLLVKNGSGDPTAGYIMALAEGIEMMVDCIIVQTPADWGISPKEKI